FDSQPAAFWLWFPVMVGFWISLAWLNDLYDVVSATDKLMTAGRVLIVAGLTFMVYLVAFFLAPREALPRIFFVSFLLVNTGSFLLWRSIYASWHSRAPMQYRILIVGDGMMARTLSAVLQHTPQVKYTVIGYVSVDAQEDVILEREVGGAAAVAQPPTQMIGRQHLRQSDGGEPHATLPVLGSQQDLGYLVNHLRVHEVVVALEQPLDQAAFQSLIECQAWGVKVSDMADLYEKLNYSIPVEYISPAWALHAIQDRPVFNRVQLAFKRLLDVTLAGLGLLLLLPLFPIVALAIKLSAPGPLFYRQTRCGQAGQPFTILKFRSMAVDAEGDGQARWATRGDDRITPVGRLLRKTRIDELPQLVNVLRGEMSIVGPRPERPEFVAKLQSEVPFYYTRLMVKPGITGWAQIHYDYGNTVEDALIKLQYDFYYLRYWSIWLDLYTIFQTIKVIFMFKGM
ncbi:MAG: sugar transferase, partial [Oscillochloris sp.]|nr:sugar transferase [Oscillochloris sp.]